MRKTLAALTCCGLLLTLAACGSDDPTPAATASTSSAPAGSTLALTGLATLKFDVTTLTASVGKAYTVELHQKGSIPHTFTLKEFGIDLTSSKEGKVETATFTPDKAGTFTYLCKFHPDMTGKLTVA